MLMRKIFYISIITILAIAASCTSKQGGGEVIHTYDTSKSIVRTDSGVFVKVSYLLDDRETTMELRKARGEGETEPFMRYAYGYDVNGNKILTICSAYNHLKKDFVHVSMEEKEYDDSENATLTTLYVEEKRQWCPQERHRSTYDNRGNELTLETYEPNGGDWLIRTKTYFKYDNYNNVIEKTDFRADEKGEWHPVEKFQREYNKSLLVMEITSVPTRDNNWVEKTKAEYEYNASHQCTKTTSYMFKYGKWVNYVQSVYTFDATGNMIDCETYFWNERTGRWAFHDKEEY